MGRKPLELRGTIGPSNDWAPVIQKGDTLPLTPTEKLSNTLEIQELELLTDSLVLLIQKPNFKKSVDKQTLKLVQASIVDTKLFIRSARLQKETPQSIREVKWEVAKTLSLAQKAMMAYDTQILLKSISIKENALWLSPHKQKVLEMEQPLAYTYLKNLLQVKTHIDAWLKNGIIDEFTWWNLLKFANPPRILQIIYTIEQNKTSQEHERQMIQEAVKEFMKVVLKDSQEA